MIWVESPSNLLLRVTDVPALVTAVKKVNSEIIIVLDNTFLGPFFQVRTSFFIFILVIIWVIYKVHNVITFFNFFILE